MAEGIVVRAKDFAIRAHQSISHKRKYTGEDYEVHLKRVASLVSEVTDDQNMVAAAWLHDVVEDTPVTINEVFDEFGPGIAKLVFELTDVSKPSDGNRKERKALDRKALGKVSIDAKTIKLADVIDNSADIIRNDKKFAPLFIEESLALLDVLVGGNEKLYYRARRLLKKGQSLFKKKQEGQESIISHISLQEQIDIARLVNYVSVIDIALPLSSSDSAVTLEGDPRTPLGYKMLEENSVYPIVWQQVLNKSGSILDVIHILDNYKVCFLRDSQENIDHYITRENLESLIGRMWLFGVVTLIERIFDQIIQRRFGRDSIREILSENRFLKAKSLYEERMRIKKEVEFSSCLQLSDKIQVVLGDEELRQWFGFKSRKQVKTFSKELSNLRNLIAHSQKFVDGCWDSIFRLAIDLYERTVVS